MGPITADARFPGRNHVSLARQLDRRKQYWLQSIILAIISPIIMVIYRRCCVALSIPLSPLFSFPSHCISALWRNNVIKNWLMILMINNRHKFPLRIFIFRTWKSNLFGVNREANKRSAVIINSCKESKKVINLFVFFSMTLCILHEQKWNCH